MFGLRFFVIAAPLGAPILCYKQQENKYQNPGIDSATEVPDDFGAFSNWNIHRLSGNMKDYWSIKVNKNYRIIFPFDGQHAYDVDYLDYH